VEVAFPDVDGELDAGVELAGAVNALAEL